MMQLIMDDEQIKTMYRARYVSEVLRCYLALRK